MATEYNRGEWPTMGILSKELEFLDQNNFVVVKDWIVVEGHETRGRVSSYNSKGNVQRSHLNTEADKGVA